MGTQPVRRAINLGEAEMTGGPGLLTVKGTVTLGFLASLTPSRHVLCSGFFFTEHYLISLRAQAIRSSVVL